MTIEQQVPSLETCRRLKELGYPQASSSFYWMKMLDPNIYGKKPEHPYQLRRNDEETWGDDRFSVDKGDFAAPTVAELGEALPPYTRSYFATKLGNQWNCTLTMKSDIQFFGETEAKARALMWIYLKERNLLP